MAEPEAVALLRHATDLYHEPLSVVTRAVEGGGQSLLGLDLGDWPPSPLRHCRPPDFASARRRLRAADVPDHHGAFAELDALNWDASSGAGPVLMRRRAVGCVSGSAIRNGGSRIYMAGRNPRPRGKGKGARQQGKLPTSLGACLPRPDAPYSALRKLTKSSLSVFVKPSLKRSS